MKNFLKQNWFKILIILFLVLFLWLYRYDFIPREDEGYFRCNRITGNCDSQKTLGIF